MKKSSLVLIWGLAFSNIASIASATSFTDIESHWGKASIEWAAENEIVAGYPDGTFKPNNPITEAEFLALLFRVYPNVKREYERLMSENTNYKNWYDPYYEIAREVNSPVGLYTEPMSRRQAAKIIAGAYGMNYDTNGSITFIYDLGLSKGKGEKLTISGFDAKAKLTRAEAVQFLKTISDKGLNKRMAVRAYKQSKNKNEKKYRDLIDEGDLVVPTQVQVQSFLDTYGYSLQSQFDLKRTVSFGYGQRPSAIEVVIPDGGDVFTVTVGATSIPNVEKHLKQVLELYGLPTGTVESDFVSMKKNSGKIIHSKYGKYTVMIFSTGAAITFSFSK